MNQRAWSTLEIKAIDADKRIVEGIASTPSPDRGGDVMEPAGASYTLPMPFLWQHAEPIGEVFEVTVKESGIYIKARVSTVQPSAPQRLKDRIEEAWHSFTSTPPLVRGLSIGWSPLESSAIKGTALRKVSKWIWGELSAVVVPMNAEATILSVKSADQPAALGQGASKPPSVLGLSQRTTMFNASETLTTEKSNLSIKTAALDVLFAKEQAEGGLEADDQTEFETLSKDIKALTAKVNHLTIMEEAQRAQAGTLPTAVTRISQPPMPRVEVKSLPKGTLFTRYAMAVAAGRGSQADTLAYAKRWTNTPEVVDYVKALQGTASSASPGWGSELVNVDTAATEFVELLMPETIIGKVSGFRNVPFNIPIITQTAGSTFAWVGEGAPKPVGELAFTRTTLPYHKVAGIVVLTEELIRLSKPSAEEAVRRDLVEQCAKFLDEAFIQIAKAAGANNPASITNGVTAPNASGTTLAALMADLNTALNTLTAAGLPLDGLVIVTTPETAVRLSLMVTSLGQTPSGLSMSPTGGTLLGYPVIVSNSVDADTLVIFKPSEIFMANDGRVTLDSSNQATLDLTGSTSPTFSLWQRNCVGLRAEQWITWAKRRTTVVAIIDTIAYVPGT